MLFLYKIKVTFQSLYLLLRKAFGTISPTSSGQQEAHESLPRKQIKTLKGDFLFIYFSMTESSNNVHALFIILCLLECSTYPCGISWFQVNIEWADLTEVAKPCRRTSWTSLQNTDNTGIGLYRDVWIASSRTRLATLTVVMCNMPQCKLRSLRVNSGMLNVICIVAYYTLPPIESPDPFWITMAFSR